MSLKLGDVIENAIWMTGDEPADLKEKYRKDVLGTMDDLCAREGFEHGAITMHELRPGDDRCPEVPSHIRGSKVRLLVVESTLVKKLLIGGDPYFAYYLDHKDLVRLRYITRKAVLKNTKRNISDDECDEIIETLGPDAAIDTLRTVH